MGKFSCTFSGTFRLTFITAPNQVYMWDITYLNGSIKGTYYYLYMISDLFSRKIVAWEIWNEESAEHASELIRKAVILETLYSLGITPSRSRPRVSNDNLYAESLFKTMKYCPNYQPKGLGSLAEARKWVK